MPRKATVTLADQRCCGFLDRIKHTGAEGNSVSEFQHALLESGGSSPALGLPTTLRVLRCSAEAAYPLSQLKHPQGDR